MPMIAETRLARRGGWRETSQRACDWDEEFAQIEMLVWEQAQALHQLDISDIPPVSQSPVSPKLNMAPSPVCIESHVPPAHSGPVYLDSDGHSSFSSDISGAHLSLQLDQTDNQPPQQSKLFARLFPQKASAAKISNQQLQKQLEAFSQENTSLKSELAKRDAQISALREKSLKLEARVKSLSSSTPQSKRLDAEREEFHRYRVEEISRIEAAREESLKQVRRERSAWEKNRKAQEILPNKREKLEITILKKELSEAKEEYKRKESKHTLAFDRLKRKTDLLTRENKEIQEELNLVEAERVSLMDECHSLKREQQAASSVTLVGAPNNRKHHASSSIRCASGAMDGGTQFGGMIGVAPANKGVRTASRPGFSIDTENSRTRKPQGSADDEAARIALNALAEQLNLQDEQYTTRYNRTSGKHERIYRMTTLTHYPNSTTKQQDKPVPGSAGGGGAYTIRFPNGDFKRVDQESTVYWFAANNTRQTTYSKEGGDPATAGLVVCEFANGQVEKSWPDGRGEVVYADGTVKTTNSLGEERTVFPDGTILS